MGEQKSRTDIRQSNIGVAQELKDLERFCLEESAGITYEQPPNLLHT